MKVICYAQRLEIGGTQVNALDLAAELRDRFGCDVVLFATPGPMATVVTAKRLRFVAAPDAYLHPSPPRMAALRDLVRAERPDVVHAWDWWQGLDAFYGVHAPWGVPLVITDMMPEIFNVLPKRVPTTFGTPELAELARSRGRADARALLPPVDVAGNAPGSADPEPFRRRFGLDDRCRNIVLVSRLSVALKSESLRRAIDAMRVAGPHSGLRLVVVGEGELRPTIEALAAEVNDVLGRAAVVLTGALLDPRPAYAAADVIVGMGSSALRGLAFAKPVIVVGERGFSEVFGPSTADRFLHGGMFGFGNGETGGERLARQLTDLCRDPAAMQALGEFGRRFVERNFALGKVCGDLHAVLSTAVASPPTRIGRLAETLRTSAVYLRERRFRQPSRDRRPNDAVTDRTPGAAVYGALGAGARPERVDDPHEQTVQEGDNVRESTRLRVLVTGGAGFLGSHLCEKLLEAGHEVLCVDNFFTGTRRNVAHLLDNRNFELMRHDVTFPLYVEVDRIFNLACPASPIHYQHDPVQTTKTSVHGAINMLGLAKRVRARILQASTSEVYGDPEVHPQPESYWGRVNPIGIRSCYDEGKRCAETLFFDYHRQLRLAIKVARIFNTYGPRMHPDDGRVVSNFIVQALQDKPITVYGNGSQTRSFCYVSDLIGGLTRLMDTPEDFTGPVNLGNPEEFTILELAERVIALTNSKSRIERLPLPADDPRQRRPDTTLAESVLGWRATTRLDDGLRATIAYFDRLLAGR